MPGRTGLNLYDFQVAAGRCGPGAEADRFAAVLVSSAGLDWCEVVTLRAYAGLLRQTTAPYGLGRIEAVLASLPDLATALVALFHVYFDSVDPLPGVPTSNIARTRSNCSLTMPTASSARTRT